MTTRDANGTKPTDLDMAHARLAELIHAADETMRAGYKLSPVAWQKLRLAGDEVARLQAELTARRGRRGAGV
jgi:hypothetical protein